MNVPSLSRARMIGVLGALALPALAPRSVRAADTYTLRASVATAPGSTHDLVVERFAAAVAKRSGGQLTIEVFPSSQLVKQSDTINALSSGVVDLVLDSSVVLQNVLPQIQVFDMPFLFKDLDTGLRVLDGPVGDYFSAQLATKGISVLAWGSGGLKQLETTSRLITVPDDMKGLKIRILPFPIYAAMYQALGAVPLSIDFAETYMALQQHTVEAIDSSLDAATAANMYVVCKRCALSNHIFSVTPLVANKAKVDALPPALQKILKEEAHAVIPFWRATYNKHIGDVIETMKKNGVAFNEIQHAPFRAAMEPVYATYRTKLGGDLLDRVSSAANA